jgi:hypothetical protein
VGKFSVIADYFHSFLNQSTIDFFKDPAKGGLGSPNGVRFYDAFGIGAEFLTEGHVFHLNFTNAIEILENRLIPRNTKSWGKGEYRWLLPFHGISICCGRKGIEKNSSHSYE